MATVEAGVGQSKRNHETEVKIRIEDPRALRSRLKQLGYIRLHRRSFEDNVLFDTEARALRGARSILRLRRYGSSWSVTYKGTPEPDRYFKSRLELESEISHPAALEAIFDALGLKPVFRYQKHRTRFAPAKGEGHGRSAIEVAFDETPIGNYIELEGSRRAIDRLARALGYSRGDYTTKSYGALYLEYCAARSLPPSDMLVRLNRPPTRKKKSTGKRPKIERTEMNR